MSDLISREALIEEIKQRAGMWQKTAEKFIAVIKEQPTVEVKEVVRGEWIDDTGCLDSMKQYKCSECGKRPILSSNWVSMLTNYCPNCGADMRKKV